MGGGKSDTESWDEEIEKKKMDMPMKIEGGLASEITMETHHEEIQEMTHLEQI